MQNNDQLDIVLQCSGQSRVVSHGRDGVVGDLLPEASKFVNAYESSVYFVSRSRLLPPSYPLSSLTSPVSVSVRSPGGCFIISFTILCILCASLVLSLCTCGTSLIVFPFLLPLLFILPFCCL
ncbi:hypothetical protein TrVE_jg6641 [Triparma verrucosa]|uniref:Uncharacterized protein n=2 Tax=Triparma TaxID=722752 RepID=A0A9W7AP73_9STRA|nr:hypothetical protein TrST_g1482 [Triparma strigata]GMH96654.1 hypothetical protein TrVE_jg6641 [Triparma verrucosa]